MKSFVCRIGTHTQVSILWVNCGSSQRDWEELRAASFSSVCPARWKVAETTNTHQLIQIEQFNLIYIFISSPNTLHILIHTIYVNYNSTVLG